MNAVSNRLQNDENSENDSDYDKVPIDNQVTSKGSFENQIFDPNRQNGASVVHLSASVTLLFGLCIIYG